MKEKSEIVCDYGYVYKSKSKVMLRRVKLCNVVANYKYNFLDVVYLSSGVLVVIIGFHPESDKHYFIEVCQRKKVVLGREQWISTKEYIDNVGFLKDMDSFDYIVGKAPPEDTKEVLISFVDSLETVGLFFEEVEEMREIIKNTYK